MTSDRDNLNGGIDRLALALRDVFREATAEAVSTGVAPLRRSVSELTTSVSGLSTGVAEVRGETSQIHHKVQRVGTRIDQMNERMGAMEHRMNRMDERMDVIERRLPQAMTQEEYDALPEKDENTLYVIVERPHA